MAQHSVSHYAHMLRGDLPAEVFAPEPRRLLWLVPHLALIAGGIIAVAQHLGGWLLAPFLSLVIGHSFACIAFIAHETLHGATVRRRGTRHAIGWLGFMPFLVSPTVWVAWHNKSHHAHTAQEGIDPDIYPTLAEYRASRVLRAVHHITPGAHRGAGLLTLFLGFLVQSTKMLFGGRKLLGLTPAQQRTAAAETLINLAVWGALAALIGPLPFLFAYVLPLLIGNSILTAYILTNHCLSPLTPVNDPLLNSLSVTVPRVFERLHLEFGFHVEHHIFPSMSPRWGRRVRGAILQRWPGRYQSMPFLRALRRIFSTPRVYKDAVTLVDPANGHEFPTLAPLTAARSASVT